MLLNLHCKAIVIHSVLLSFVRTLPTGAISPSKIRNKEQCSYYSFPFVLHCKTIAALGPCHIFRIVVIFEDICLQTTAYYTHSYIICILMLYKYFFGIHHYARAGVCTAATRASLRLFWPSVRVVLINNCNYDCDIF